MEEPDELYRTLCSAETVRSGKKGFFHDFSDYVTSAAGEAWTAKIFSRLKRDEDRVTAVFTDAKVRDVVVETLDRVQPLFRDKDAEISRRRRLEGHRLAEQGRLERALLVSSQAVLRAPVAGKCKAVDQGFSLPLALLGRADVFAALNEHELALKDLEMADDAGLPEKLRAELRSKRDGCQRLLRDNERSLVPLAPAGRKEPGHSRPRKPTLPTLTGGENRELPGASSLLEIRETTAAGKQAVAKRAIEPGDVLVVEPPLAGCLLPDFYGTHCHHCYSRLRAPVGCPSCSSVAFCCGNCRDDALATYHRYECKILALLIGSGMSILSMLAFRLVTQQGLQGCLKLHEELTEKGAAGASNETAPAEALSAEPRLSKSARRRLRKKKLKESMQENGETDRSDGNNGTRGDSSALSRPDSHSRRADIRAYDLVTHDSRRSAGDFLERTLMAAFLLRCLRTVGFFADQSVPENDSPSENENEIAVGALLLRNLQLLQFNAHEFFETRAGAGHRFRGSRPVYLGVAIYPTVARFNHDCYPAVTRYFVGTRIVIRATRSLKPGDVVAENYGPIFTKRSLVERQRTLAARYWFRCACRACTEDWPRFESLTNDIVRLRCPTENCEGLHRRPATPSKATKCPVCRAKVGLAGRLADLLECEELYQRGLVRMDEGSAEEAAGILSDALKRFHRVAVPPHRDTHLAEVALAACFADSGNTWTPMP